MRIFDVDCVVSVYPENDLYYQHDGNGLRAVNNGNGSGLRLERDLLYRHAGGIILTRHNPREAGRNIFNGRVGHVPISRKAAMRVYDIHDFKLATALVDVEQEEAMRTRIQAPNTFESTTIASGAREGSVYAGLEKQRG